MDGDRILRIYTDGGCSGNQNDVNIGGWGAVMEFGPARRELCGGERNTTNNRMEMTALLQAFRAIKKEGQRIDVFSDSSYLMDCFRKGWYVRWRQNGWKTSQKKDVENRDLWEALLPYLDLHEISFYRVKGHVDTEAGAEKLEKLYDKFRRWNGGKFSYEDFIYTCGRNNRADELANSAIDRIRREEISPE